MNDMRIGFVTAVQLGLSCLEEIERIGGKLNLLITLDDHIAIKKSGRVTLDEYAVRTGVPLHKTKHINDIVTAKIIEEANLDYLLVIGWSQLIDPKIFNYINYALLGMHPTLLPEGRGRAPIPWTILKGLSRSGVSLFELMPEADTGQIFAVEQFEIGYNDTATELYKKALDAHVALTRKMWPDLISGNLCGVPQDDSRATNWPQRRPEDGQINEDMSLDEIEKLVRATTHPYPGAYIMNGDRKLIIWRGRIIETSNSQFVLSQLVRGDLCYEPIDYDWRNC